jgi:hypothetical protein
MCRTSERFLVGVKPQGLHGPQQVVPVDGLALLTLALVARPAPGGVAESEARAGALCPSRPATHSLVMKLMNSDTHSCTVSFASFAILALDGRARFIMRL